jgi:hypothetical protein
MSDQQPERRERPVINGLIALGAVAITVGLVLAGATLVATNVLGIGGGEDASSGSTEKEVMSIPPPQQTTEAGGPAITLDTEDPDSGEGEASSDSSEPETSEPTKSKSPKDDEISLSAGQLEVENFGRIDLTGVYPGGEGTVLQVQRLQDRQWVDFAATVAVVNETFSTYVQTGVNGENVFRVIDKESGVASNRVKVRVGG